MIEHEFKLKPLVGHTTPETAYIVEDYPPISPISLPTFSGDRYEREAKELEKFLRTVFCTTTINKLRELL